MGYRDLMVGIFGDYDRIKITEEQFLANIIPSLRRESPISERNIDGFLRRYGLAGNNTHTYKELANVMGVSRTRIAQICSKYEATIKQPIRSKYILSGDIAFIPILPVIKEKP